jgi:hypothetical protein
VAGEIDKIAGGGEDSVRPPRYVETYIGEHDPAWSPLDQRGAQFAFQFADLHGQRRLGNGAILSGAAEMPEPRERRQITQLAQGGSCR